MGKAAERVSDYCLSVLGGKVIVLDKMKTQMFRTLYDKHDCKGFFFCCKDYQFVAIVGEINRMVVKPFFRLHKRQPEKDLLQLFRPGCKSKL